MAKASDNVFPKVILGTGTVPAAPSDSSWRMYAQADGIYARSSNTTAGPFGAGAGGAVATDAIWDAKGDLAAGTGANAASKLSVGTDGQILTADSGEATGLKWASGAGVVPWYIPPMNGIAHVSYIAAAANWAIYIPCVIPVACTITGARVAVGTQSGNISVALYDSGGSRVATTGDIACPATAISGTSVAFTGNYSAAPGRYYIGLSMSSGTATFSYSGTSGQVTPAAVKYQTSAHPCPATIAATGNTNYALNVYLLVSGGFPT